MRESQLGQHVLVHCCLYLTHGVSTTYKKESVLQTNTCALFARVHAQRVQCMRAFFSFALKHFTTLIVQRRTCSSNSSNVLELARERLSERSLVDFSMCCIHISRILSVYTRCILVCTMRVTQFKFIELKFELATESESRSPAYT